MEAAILWAGKLAGRGGEGSGGGNELERVSIVPVMFVEIGCRADG